MKPICVIIPVYGKQELTNDVLNDISLEKDLVDTIIIDNKGDYQGECIKSGSNLGWLNGTNYGLEYARGKYQLYICMNNDVRLSKDFFAKLLPLTQKEDCGLFSPVYRGDFWHQRPGNKYQGPANEYVPTDTIKVVAHVDGTCMCIPARTLDAIGLLDKRFGNYGWGADHDYAIRVRQNANKKIYVTEQAYLYHIGQATAKENKSYKSNALIEQDLKLTEKYGENYKKLIWAKEKVPNFSKTTLSIDSKIKEHHHQKIDVENS